MLGICKLKSKNMEDIIETKTKTKTKIKDGIKYTTHYVNRPIRQGDTLGGSIGMMINGVSKTTEIIRYVYK
jgi:hypothetical protein